MAEIVGKVRVIEGAAPGEMPLGELMDAGQPTLLKGLARDWPLVRRGLRSPREAADYLTSFYSGRPVTALTGKPEIKGRFFYNADVSGMNFDAGQVQLDAYMQGILDGLGDLDAPSFYVGSTDVDHFLPGLRAENDLRLDADVLGPVPPLVSIWIGNRTVATAHYDMSNNLACCMVGRRRFTLFPPDQVQNLYPGPLEPTPGGQVVSMVDFDCPDFDDHPRFREAMAMGQVAELEPGDVLFYPALWWHHVEALDPFNVMINYWWNASPKFMDTPQNTLLHALLSLRDRPEAEKQAWKHLFDYYVFGPAERAGAHLPEHARGNLGRLDEPKARRLRANLINRLNR